MHVLVTEFLHGHLNQPGSLPAVMCFRDQAYDDSKRTAALANGDQRTATMFTAESDESVRHMNDLKHRVEITQTMVRSECKSRRLQYDMSLDHADHSMI